MLSIVASSAISSLGIVATSVSASDGNLPLFKLTLIVPIGDPVKYSWAQILYTNLRQLGIDCQIAMSTMNDVYLRALMPNATALGKGYDQGGFDVLLLGYQMLPSPDPSLFYNSTQFPPSGRNYYLWNDSYNDQLCSQIRQETNVTKRLELERTWQSYAMEWLPSTAVFYANGTIVANRSLDINAFSTLNYPIWPAVERWSGNMAHLNYNVSVAQLQNATDLMPIFSESYFDKAVMNPVYGPAGFGLFQLSETTPRRYLPCIADNWTVSPDYRNWTIHIRSNVTFHDDVQLTGDDVNFTLRAYMSPALGSPLYPLFVSAFGSNSSIYFVNASTVKILLPRPYAYAMDLLSVPILPAHILKYINYTKWRTSPLNTGIPSSVQLLNGTQINLTGPVGAGPYRYIGYDSATKTYHLQKFGTYFNRTTLETRGLFQINDYYVKVINSGQTALQQLANGGVHVLDMQYHFELLAYSYLGENLTSFIHKCGGNLATFNSFEVQELAFNMRHPVFGTGLDTPVGKTSPSSAATAAKHVRKAISYAIPRLTVVQQLLQGYGLPGRTSVFCPPSEGYDQTVPFYEFNMTQAAQELRLAGYEPAPLVAGFWESYGVLVIIVVVAILVVVTLVVLRRTGWASKLRKPGIAEKRIK
jgi:ABC-type transport system substrate-binding protein